MKINLLSTSLTIITAIAFLSGPLLAQEIPSLEITDLNVTATETIKAPVTAEPITVPEQNTKGRKEKRGAIIKVDNGMIYTDSGAIEGVAVGDFMIIYKMEPLTDLKGNILDQEEVSVGKVVIEEVRNRVSLGRQIAGNEQLLRGYFVKYWVADKSSPEQVNASSKKCPPEMLYDDGGVFQFQPGSVSKITATAATPEVADTEPFCIDKNPGEGFLSWAEAKQLCTAVGKRLCEKPELQKVCSTWDKPAPCDPDLQAIDACPEQNTVMDFRYALEWTTDIGVKDGMPIQDAYSCSCPGPDPVCVHCFYDQCRGAEKRYRCCSNPY